MMSKNIIKQYYSERRHEIEVIWWLKSRYLYFKESVKFDPLSLFLCMFIPFFSVYCISLSLIYPPFIVSWYMYLQDLLPFLSSLCEIHPLCFLFIRSLWYIFILRYLKKIPLPLFLVSGILTIPPPPDPCFYERLNASYLVSGYMYIYMIYSPYFHWPFFPLIFPPQKFAKNFSNVNKSWFTVFQLFSF